MSQLDPKQSGQGTPGDVDAEVQRELAALGDQTVEQLMNDAPPPTASSGDAPNPGGEAGSAPSVGAAADDDREHPQIETAVRRGRVTMIQDEDVFVELSGVEGKNQGMVPLKQFERPPRLGSIMDFVIERFDQAEGFYVLSREGAITRSTWEHLQRGALIEARVVATNKGGLELEMVGGIRAFMPASQIDMHHVTNMEEYVGQKVQAMVQDIDRKGRKVVLSRRSFLEHQRKAKRVKIMAELEVGQTREGVVSGVMEYGAFVDLGGVDGLIHISDLSYKHVNKVEEVVKAGQQVKVKVLKLDKERERISLGLKQVEPDPWETIATRIHVGDQISGRVMRTADFGAFIEVEPGVEGLLPASEMSWKRHTRVQDMVKETDVLKVMVLQLDVEKRRVTLSLKQAAGDPWHGAATKWARNTVVEATVTSVADFGAFVEIEMGVEGLVHISELSDKRVNTVGDVLKVGDKKSFRVLETDEGNRRIRLSLKAAEKPLAEPTPAPAAAAAAPGKPAAAKKAPLKPGKGGIGASAAMGIGLGQLKL